MVILQQLHNPTRLKTKPKKEEKVEEKAPTVEAKKEEKVEEEAKKEDMKKEKKGLDRLWQNDYSVFQQCQSKGEYKGAYR